MERGDPRQRAFPLLAAAKITIALVSTLPGQTTTHQIGFDITLGQLETFQAIITYPAAFTFNGFTALGPANTQVATYGVDFDFNGTIDFTIPVRSIDANTAYADRDLNGSFNPAIDSTVAHTVQNGNHVFTITLPFGGDGNQSNIAGPFNERATATLLAGVLTNPATPGCYMLTGNFTSVDPDTGGATDNVGTSPINFTSSNYVRIGTPAASSTLFASVLPGSRSVQLGTPATLFATVINAGAQSATNVGISPNGTVAAGFLYQTTDPLTNAVTGAPNTPVTIPPGGSQSFLLALTPLAAVTPTEVEFNFCGGDGVPVGKLSGLNTLLLSASSTPIPDVVALAGTLPPDPGIVNIPGNVGTGVFVVATVNVGASGNITASADTGTVTLAVNLSLCQTNPTTGACLSPPTSSVTTTVNANATPTFGIFVTGTGNVPFNPATNLIFVRFKDSGNVTRGSTSVAVRTQ